MRPRSRLRRFKRDDDDDDYRRRRSAREKRRSQLHVTAWRFVVARRLKKERGAKKKVFSRATSKSAFQRAARRSPRQSARAAAAVALQNLALKGDDGRLFARSLSNGGHFR